MKKWGFKRKRVKYVSYLDLMDLYLCDSKVFSQGLMLVLWRNSHLLRSMSRKPKFSVNIQVFMNT